MKKQLLKLGKALNKAEQKSINGGGGNWVGHCFPSEGKCNHYCNLNCTPCGIEQNGYTPHVCGMST